MFLALSSLSRGEGIGPCPGVAGGSRGREFVGGTQKTDRVSRHRKLRTWADHAENSLTATGKRDGLRSPRCPVDSGRGPG